MADVKLKQVRSSNGANPKQRETLRALKLGKIGRESALTDSPQLRGMIKVVDHLVKVED
jgi:large subunit ribosomal protein L30